MAFVALRCHHLSAVASQITDNTTSNICNIEEFSHVKTSKRKASLCHFVFIYCFLRCEWFGIFPSGMITSQMSVRLSISVINNIIMIIVCLRFVVPFPQRDLNMYIYIYIYVYWKGGFPPGITFATIACNRNQSNESTMSRWNTNKLKTLDDCHRQYVTYGKLCIGRIHCT